ncbi:hypothetical protein IU402_04695 [Aerococcaceae bacterium zg-BR9]|uniref:hypothetical protein n=1 Tax=Aerococcaceae bacterium zg-1292 TaxID=2774330 RepID=UPI00406342D8|nr:hypothetical protein [Aerococcaceae bacterium zg-BR9]
MNQLQEQVVIQPKQRMMSTQQKILWTLLSIGIAILCWWFANSQALLDLTTYIAQELDGMKENVVKLTAISAASSTALTLIPGDVATPLAENLADISDYLIIVFIGLWFQKYLFSSMGLLVLKLIIPVGLAVNIYGLWIPQTAPVYLMIKRISRKIILFGVALFCVVPTTIFITNQIESTYQSTINRTIDEAQVIQNEVKQQEESENKPNNQATRDSQNNDNIMGQISGAISHALSGVVDFTTGSINNVANAVTDLPNKMIGTLNNLIDSLAILIVVNCIAPILIFVILVWLMNLIFGINLKPRANPVGIMGNFTRQRLQKNGAYDEVKNI